MSASNANALVHALYGKVVTDVIAKSREEFLGEGLDASVLQELQTRWQRKLAQTGAVPVPAAPVSVSDPPAAPARGGGRAGKAAQIAATATASAAGAAAPRSEPLALLGRPLAFLPPDAGWVTDTPAATSAPPLADPAPQDASRKRKEPDSEMDGGAAQQCAAASVPMAGVPSVAPPAAAATTGAAGGSSAAGRSAADAGEELNSDDDDKDPDTKNLVLSQFEKVTKVKNKWKCILRSGVMTLNGKDCVFNTATGDFSW